MSRAFNAMRSLMVAIVATLLTSGSEMVAAQSDCIQKIGHQSTPNGAGGQCTTSQIPEIGYNASCSVDSNELGVSLHLTVVVSTNLCDESATSSETTVIPTGTVGVSGSIGFESYRTQPISTSGTLSDGKISIPLPIPYIPLVSVGVEVTVSFNPAENTLTLSESIAITVDLFVYSHTFHIHVYDEPISLGAPGTSVCRPLCATSTTSTTNKIGAIVGGTIGGVVVLIVVGFVVKRAMQKAPGTSYIVQYNNPQLLSAHDNPEIDSHVSNSHGHAQGTVIETANQVCDPYESDLGTPIDVIVPKNSAMIGQ